MLNYGGLSNDLFLLDYGFVIPDNPFDHIELKYDGTLLDAASMAAGVSSASFSSPAKWQQEILSQLNLTGDSAVPKVFCPPLSPSTCACVRRSFAVEWGFLYKCMNASPCLFLINPLSFQTSISYLVAS